ncbi:MAG: aminopeptidase P N-terminal domain-containing protein [Tidjanibacter sp.]|nr:aminopeptidase P N-terminal domain-containing protein [Tidjanibacter sp.]
MLRKESYIRRRQTLRDKIKEGIIILPGNNEAPKNYFDNAYNFRQDSTFLYFFGLNMAGLTAIIDVDAEKDMLFGNDFTVDDIIWMGPQPSLKELGAQVGVEETAPACKAAEVIEEAIRKGRRIHFLNPYRSDTALQLSRWTGIHPDMMIKHFSTDLNIAIAEMREVKDEEEIAELENAFEIGYQMHTRAMKATKPGVTEREIAGLIKGTAESFGDGVSFHSIVSQHGETLHNHSHDGILEAGRLLLIDIGGENLNNYCSDHTRTIPVSGKFSPKQKDIYNIVLSAVDKVFEVAAPGKYMNVFNEALKTLAEGLIGVGLMKGNAADAVEAGAVWMFMPHGLSHGIGLDVHDCENLGERGLSDFSALAARANEIDTCIMRNNWRLRPGTVMSNEPGIYFIPALIEKWKSEKRHEEFINYSKLESYYDFGGIRIEEDVLITENGNRRIGLNKRIPATIEEIENFMA